MATGDDIVVTEFMLRCGNSRCSHRCHAVCAHLQGSQDEEGEHHICSTSEPLQQRMDNAQLFDYILPSANALQLPGCVETLPALVAQGKHLHVWTVDDSDTVARIAGANVAVSSVVTNVPAVIAPHCFGK